MQRFFSWVRSIPFAALNLAELDQLASAVMYSGARLASEEGYINTETTQLGDRVVAGKTRKNIVDMRKPGGAEDGGTRYVEVDPMNNNGLPDPPMVDKLKAEIAALKPGEDLLFVDSDNFNRRTLFKYGDDPSVVETRPGPTAPRRPPRTTRK